MIITRKWAMPSKDTFTIKPIAQLLARYVGNGKGWIDPFSGNNSPAEYTNDINGEKKTLFHLEAIDFVKMWDVNDVIINGALFDPPYSVRQLQECYAGMGRAMSQEDSQGAVYTKVKDGLSRRIKMDGLAICFGWSTIGLGKKRGFHLEEILIVCHGRLHNDTLVTVERKTSHQEKMNL